MCDPPALGLVDPDRRGRAFCDEQCKEECFAWKEWRDSDFIGPFDRSKCGATCPEIMLANQIAVRCYQSAYWQFQGSGLGDATFPGQYMQTMLGDLGVIGPDRIDQMDRMQVMDEQRRASDIIRRKCDAENGKGE